MSVRRILSDDEELMNGLGSESVQFTSVGGNHMARTGSRWLAIDDTLADALHSKLNTCKLADGVHEPIEIQENTAPGQLYSTNSGKLFHAGKILIVLVGLPATSKTLLSVAITRYTRWLGVRTESFHASEYRKVQGPITDDTFSASPLTEEGIKWRTKIIETVFNDMINFFQNTKGQLAIFDALNIKKIDRHNVRVRFSKLNVKVLFIESIITNPKLVQHNIKTASQSSEFKDFTKEEAQDIYMARLMINKPLYEEMTKDEELCFVKYVNFGEQVIVHNMQGGYLINKIVFFLMNLKNSKGSIYFARCGTSDEDKYVNDELLNEEGIRYAKKLTDVVLDRVQFNKKSKSSSTLLMFDEITKVDKNNLTVFTAERKRTHDTGKFFDEEDIPVIQKSELKQLRPGIVADLSDEEIKAKYPIEYEASLKDPYHFRYPRAESYHDLAIRMEPLLLEMERMSQDILIIGHESTLRVLYGYFMASTCFDLTNLQFPRNELVEISFTPFQNEVKRIPLEY